MAGLARVYSRIIRKHIQGAHAAFLPVTNNFAVGDFGVISGGVFVRMGNVASDFGVALETLQSPTSERFDLSSEGVKVRRLVAGMEVDVLPTGSEDLDAQLEISFEQAQAAFIRCGQLQLTELQSPFAVGAALDAHPAWKGRFKLVTGTWSGTGVTMKTALAAGTTISAYGSVGAIQALELGKVGAGVEWSGSEEVGLDVSGGDGVVALRLARVRRIGGAVVPVLASDKAAVEVEALEGELEDDF